MRILIYLSNLVSKDSNVCVNFVIIVSIFPFVGFKPIKRVLKLMVIGKPNAVSILSNVPQATLALLQSQIACLSVSTSPHISH